MIRDQQQTNFQSGYIAIVTALILSLLVLFVGVSTGTITLLSRYSRLEALNKNISAGTAQSCLQYGLLKLGEDYNYAGDATITVSGYDCHLYSISTSGSNKILKAKSSVYGDTTNYQLTVDASLTPLTLEEVPRL